MLPPEDRGESSARHFLLLSLAVVVVAASCNSLPPPSPTDAKSAGVGISVLVRAPIAIFSGEPDTVLFVKLPESGEIDFQHGVVAQSNYSSDGYWYLLGTEPGRYAAVACFRSQKHSGAAAPPPPGFSMNMSVQVESTTYFPTEMIRMSQTDVRPGQIAFMGSYTVDQSVGLDGADPVQLHCYRMIEPGNENRSGFSRLMSGQGDFRGTLHASDHSEVAATGFFDKSLKNLAGAGWSPMIRH